MPTPLINEVVRNHLGSDTNEFIEILGDPNTNYSDLFVIEIEGDSGSSSLGEVTSVTRMGTTDENGFFATNFLDNVIQNGTSTLFLVSGWTGSVGIALDTNTDGTLDEMPWDAVLDSIALSDGGQNDLTYSDVVIEPGFDGVEFDAGGVSRIQDGVDTDSVSDWIRNDFEGQGLGVSFPNNSATDGEAINTPGAPNEFVGQPIVIGDGVEQAVSIYDIQGAGHISPLLGATVRTTGIVTGVGGNGFYLQDPAGDGNAATSDGIFVSTNGAPTVAVGDNVEVLGVVEEIASSDRLSVTQIDLDEVAVSSSGNSLPEAVVLGEDGLSPPTEVIFTPQSDEQIDLAVRADANSDDFDPITDGIDFFEALEGMRVTLTDAVAIAPINGFGEIWTVLDSGDNASGYNERGGVSVAEGDFNPERIQIQIDDTLSPDVDLSGLETGQSLGSVTGLLNYDFGNFEVLATDISAPTGSAPAADVTTLAGDDDELTIASYNVLNLDPSDTDRIATIAQQLVTNLRGPDVIALQEIQDNNGTDSGVLASDQTLQALIDAIALAGGPTYSFAVVDPTSANSQGGEPNGNIRVAYLYNDERIDLVSVQALTSTLLFEVGVEASDAFGGSRVPLEAVFSFGDETVTVINNHFTARGGSDDLFGANQLPENNGDDRRSDQAAALNQYVDSLLAGDPEANVVVLGDFNDFEFSDALDILAGGSGADQILFNQTDTLDQTDDRYTFIFQGNGQAIDHIFLTSELAENADYEIVHVNTDYVNGASDHEPIIVELDFDDESTDGTSDDDRIEGGEGNETLNGGAGDDRIFGGGGNDDLTGGTGGDTLNGGAGDDTARGGEGDDNIFAGSGDAGADEFIGGDGSDIIGGGAGDDLLIGGNLGEDVDDDGSDILFGGAGNDLLLSGSFDDLDGDGSLDAGEYIADSAGNVIWSGSGEDTVYGGDGDDVLGGSLGEDIIFAAEGDDIVYAGAGVFGDTIDAGAGGDIVFAGGGDDSVDAGAGNDIVFGGSGADVISGGSGNDDLYGAADDDTVTGGLGADAFYFAGEHGDDVITDFSIDEDTLYLASTVTDFVTTDDVVAASTTVDGGVIINTGGGTILLEGVTLDDITSLTLVLG